MVSFRYLILSAVVVTLCLAADNTTVIDISPSAFVPGVTTSVQITCRPPVGRDIAEVLSLELFKDRRQQRAHDTVISYATSDSPVVEAFGARLNVSTSGFHDPDHPESTFLTATLPDPSEVADGKYSCSVDTLDSQGLLHTYLGQAILTDHAQNGSAPVFYQSLLQELRTDLDTLTFDLSTVQTSQAAVASHDSQAQSLLSEISSDETKATGYMNDVNSSLDNASQRASFLRSTLDTLRDLTPETPVNFYAYLSSSYVTPSNGANIVFNVVEQHTDDNAYSTSTGVFTTPVNGTYFFRTGVSGYASNFAYASLAVNDQDVASLYIYDDYSVEQATAVAVVELVEGDEVKVVKKLGSRIYGATQVHHITYFMGTLLW